MNDANLPPLEDFTDRVYWVVRRVPEGRVATYGQIAFYAGSYGAARAVGTLMRNCVANGEGDIPWQRIIKSDGSVAFKGDHARAERQRELLRREGVEFRSDWRFDLEAFQWEPETAYWGESLVD